MAKKGGKSKGVISNGGRQKANVAHEAKRQEKFKAKREAGKAYEYKPIEAKKGSREWFLEKEARAEKNRSSRLDYAIKTSLFRKLDNEIAKEKERMAKVKAFKKDKATE